MRERGLKSVKIFPYACTVYRRSREGAWIEIHNITSLIRMLSVAPVRERGLKLNYKSNPAISTPVAPVRERGLKFKPEIKKSRPAMSLP